MFQVTAQEIDMAALEHLVADPGAGAVVTFAGTTRNDTGGRAVTSLTYVAYGEMAEDQLQAIGEEILSRFDVLKVAIHHRTGPVAVGEVSVGIALSSAHRPAAFEACRYAIEAIKKDVPIWKEEHFADGESEWSHPM